jgi:hypothetical protein
MSALGGKKTLGISPFLFFFIYLCFSKAEDPGTYWIANLWKAYEHPAVSALRKAAHHFSPLAGFKAACINLQTQQVSNMHHMQPSYPSPENAHPVQPLDRLNSTLNNTEKHKQ